MSEKRYSLQDVTEILKISMDTLYSLEDVIPELKPPQQTERGERLYSEWDLRLVQQACKLLQVYHQDATEARRSLELWISRNPRPQPGDVIVDSDVTEITSEMSQAPREVSQRRSYQERRREAPQERSAPTLQRAWSSQDEAPQDLEDQVEVIEQSGGRQRRIGKVGGGDLFADFTDGFDLSPSREVRAPQSQRSQSQRPQPSSAHATPSRQLESDQSIGGSAREETSKSRSPSPRSSVTSATIHQAPLEPASRSHPPLVVPHDSLSESPSGSQSTTYMSSTSTTYSKPYIASLARAEQRSAQSASDWLETQSSRASQAPSVSAISPQRGADSITSEPEEQMDWRLAYHHSQAQLARVRGELARSQELTARQHHDIKLLQSQLLGVREQVLKEIYDLRDLVLDS